MQEKTNLFKTKAWFDNWYLQLLRVFVYDWVVKDVPLHKPNLYEVLRIKGCSSYAISWTQVQLCARYTDHWFAVVDKVVEVKWFVCNMMNCTTGKRIGLHGDVGWEIEVEL